MQNSIVEVNINSFISLNKNDCEPLDLLYPQVSIKMEEKMMPPQFMQPQSRNVI
jgi:hypothetical protein